MYRTWITLMCIVFIISANFKAETSVISRRALQKDHEKPKPDQWAAKFLKPKYDFQVYSLVRLLQVIARDYLDNCKVLILYDLSVELYKQIIDLLFIKFPLSYEHVSLSNTTFEKEKFRNLNDTKCISYMLFLKDVMKSNQIIEKQHENKVLIMSASSQWRVHEFLTSDASRFFVNLLVITKSAKIVSAHEELPYILYTHTLYVDGLGASKPQILMSWYNNKLTNPKLPIFPKKMIDGFAGHRFIISVANQPPYIIDKGIDVDDDSKWDGIEIRLVKLLAEKLNFTIDIQQADEVDVLGSGDAVAKVIGERRASLGVAGLYVTKERIDSFEISHGYAYDCATFVTLVSTALPRHRAIMGPFQWTVWIALIFVYLFAIFPISFSYHLSLTYLLKQPEEIENMFWYVFGTFTNCFTFTGKSSWSKTKKDSTRLFVGWYWVFTIIISACYTGSIIAFVTLPVFPATIDNVNQLLSNHFQVGTLDKDGWQYWFNDSSDPKVNTLLKNMEHLPDIQSGLKNITTAFFWPYAFLGSRDQLRYIVKMNYTQKNKKTVMHISDECFAPFAVSMAFPKKSVYKTVLNTAILYIFQSGLMNKMKNDVDWDAMRTISGNLQANSIGKFKTPPPEDRSLTLQDTEGMFLLLGIGFLAGVGVLISEILGGCLNVCKRAKRSRYNSLCTNQQSFHVPSSNTTEMEFFQCEQETSKNSEIGSLFGNEEKRYEDMVIIQSNVQVENNDECRLAESPGKLFTSNELSNTTEMEFFQCEQETSKNSEIGSLLGNEEKRYEDMVIIHSNVQEENNDECRFAETPGTLFTSNELSNTTEMELFQCEQETSKNSEICSLFGNDEKRHEDMVILHSNVQVENNDECRFTESPGTPFTSNELSDIHNEINNWFNFDHLFGQDNSVMDDSNSHCNQYFGEKCNHDT